MKGGVCCSEIRQFSILLHLTKQCSARLLEVRESVGKRVEGGVGSSGKEHRFRNQAGLGSSTSSAT